RRPPGPASRGSYYDPYRGHLIPPGRPGTDGKPVSRRHSEKRGRRMKRLIQIFSKVLAKTIGAFRFFRSSHISVAGVPVWRKARQESRKTRTKQRLLKVAAIGIVLAAGGFLVAASGIIPIKASSGH